MSSRQQARMGLRGRGPRPQGALSLGPQHEGQANGNQIRTQYGECTCHVACSQERMPRRGT